MRFNYGLVKNFDKNYECEDYIAYLYKVITIDAQKNIYKPNPNEDQNNFFVEATLKPTKNTVSKDSFKITDPSYKMLPILRVNCEKSHNIQRDIAVICGSSGSGKTTIINNMTLIYRGLNAGNKVIYISSKNMMIDPSFKKELFNFLPFEQFMEYFTDEKIKEFETNNMWDNTLLIFDDLVMKEKAIKTRFWKIMTILLNLKRMNYITVIYCCHETSDYQYTRLLFNEMTIYITFNTDLKNRSNLILKDYLKLSKNEIEKIVGVGNRSRWSAILTRPRCVLTEDEIFALK